MEGLHQSNTYFFSFACFFFLLHISPNINPWVEDHFTSRFIVWNFFFLLFPNRHQFGTNNLRPQKHDTKGNCAGWQISPLPQISFLLEDQIGSIWGCLYLPSSIRQEVGLPLQQQRAISVSSPQCRLPVTRFTFPILLHFSKVLTNSLVPGVSRHLAQNPVSQISQDSL